MKKRFHFNDYLIAILLLATDSKVQKKIIDLRKTWCENLHCTPSFENNTFQKVHSFVDWLVRKPKGCSMCGGAFKSCPNQRLDFFLGSPEFKSSAMLVKEPTGSSPPVGILSSVMFHHNYLFHYRWKAS